MFCPNCGSEDRQASQYCRTCGTDMRAVRQGLEKPESVMASAMTAREEIGRAIAARIREVRDAGDLKVIEKVLPEIEKFFESPQEKRLRSVRAGVVTSMVGLGSTLFFLLLSLQDDGVLFLAALGVVTFLIGLGIIINALLFTVPKHPSLDAGKGETERLAASFADARQELEAAREVGLAPSVTEHTTHRLPNEPALVPGPEAGRRASSEQ